MSATMIILLLLLFAGIAAAWVHERRACNALREELNETRRKSIEAFDKCIVALQRQNACK